MTDLGLTRQFLNIKIERFSTPNKEDLSTTHTHAKFIYHIRLSQERFIDELLQRFGMIECNGTRAPLETGHDLRVQDKTSPETHSGVSSQSIDRSALILKEYQSLAGSLIYLMLSTRPDLAFTISTLSKFASAPLPMHLAVAR